MRNSNIIIFLLAICVFSFANATEAQDTLFGTLFDEKQHPLFGVSITLHKKNQFPILSFAISNKEGKFKLCYSTKDASDTLELKISLLGYSKQSTFFLPGEKGEFTFSLHPKAVELKEVKIKGPPLWHRRDTINYNVSEFKQKQDRVIGDIIRRLPGIEVMPGGQIKYNGKPINKFYIEGLDLLEDKYGIANNNIPAESVDRVQLLENHQPLRVLDSVSFSDRAAINIKLVSNAKLRLVGRAKLGIGATPLLGENEIVGMQFKKKIQFIDTYKFNNTGLDHTRELASQNINEYISAIQNGAIKNDLLGMAQPASPSVSSERYLFNKSHVLSVNQLLPLNNTLQFRINADYVNDFQQQENEVQTKIYLPGDTVTILEKSRYLRNLNLLQFNLSFLANTSKYYLKNITKYQGWWQAEKNNLIAGMDISQVLHNPYHNLSNDFKLIKAKVNFITEWSSYIGYVSLPQSLNVSPGLYSNLLNNNQPYDRLSQKASLKTFYTDNFFSLRNKKGKVKGQYKFGFNIQSKNLYSNLELEYLGNRTFLADTFQNHLQWKRYRLYIENQWTYQNEKLRLFLTLPFSYNRINYNDTLFQLNEQISKTFINPAFSGNFIISQNWAITASAFYDHSMGDIQNINSGYILKSYRNLNNNNAPLSESKTINLSANLTFRNPLKIIFFNAGISYTLRKLNLLYSQQFNGSLETLSALLMENNGNNTILNARFNKYIMDWKTSFILYSSYSFENLQQLQQQKIVTLTNRNWVLGSTINAKLSQKFTIEYSNQFNRFFSKSQLLTTGNLFLKFNQICSFNYYPSEQLIVTLSGEHYHIDTDFYSDTDYYFANINLRYKPVKSKIDYEISSQNIMNTTSFITGILFNNMETISKIQIRPRQILFKMSFSF